MIYTKKESLHEEINKKFYCAYIYHKVGTSLSAMGLLRICKYLENQSGKKIRQGIKLFDDLQKNRIH